jgi:hypothetical protein
MSLLFFVFFQSSTLLRFLIIRPLQIDDVFLLMPLLKHLSPQPQDITLERDKMSHKVR